MNNPRTHFWSPVQSHTPRVPGRISSHLLSSVMHPLCYCAFTFMCSLSLLSPVLSLGCNDRQYAWPVVHSQLCCDKCPPGNHIVKRSSTTCELECGPCVGDRYIDTYNDELACEFCEKCDEANMEYQSHCNATHNAVCRCKADYRCKDRSCKQCVPIPYTTKPTLPPSTTALKAGVLTTPPSQPIGDTVWFLVIIALLSAGLALVVVTNIKPFLRWIKSKQGYILAGEAAAVTPSSDDEGVSTPVQEVRGKCDV